MSREGAKPESVMRRRDPVRWRWGVVLFSASILLTLMYDQGVITMADEAGATEQSGVGNTSNREPSTAASDATPSFMKEQLAAFRLKLDESEARLLTFKQRHALVSLEQQKDLFLQQRNALDTSLKTSKNEAKGLATKLSWLRKKLDEIPDRVPMEGGALIGLLNSNLLILKLKEQELLTKYHEASPLVVEVRREMDLIGQLMKAKPADAQEGVVPMDKNPLYEEVEMQLLQTEAELVSVKAQSGVIQEQIHEVDRELGRIESLGKEHRDLIREVTANEQNYVSYLTKVGNVPPLDYKIEIGDHLDIKFFFNPELDESVSVRPDGRIALQLVGELMVAGRSIEEVREILVKGYSKQLTNPEVTVILRAASMPIEAKSKSTTLKR